MGFYTEVEESNHVSWLSNMPTFAQRCLQPLSKAVHNIDPALLSFAIPCNVLPRTTPSNHTRTPWHLLGPSLYGALWAEVFATWAPDPGMIAPWDNMGANGNSLPQRDALPRQPGCGGCARGVDGCAAGLVQRGAVRVLARPQRADEPTSGRRPAPLARIRQ